jgi:hypothetical protein
MTCPECGSTCDRESVHNGVCWLYSPWECSECGWSEDDGFPMLEADWVNKFAEEDKSMLVQENLR